MKKMNKRFLAVLASVVLVLTMTVGATVAYLIDQSGPITNIFTPSEVTSEVEEEFPDPYNVKQNVKIKNTGDAPAYIRAAVVFNWKSADGKIGPGTPAEGTDYEISWNTVDAKASGAKWFKAGGYYYYPDPVTNGSSTGTLITKIQNAKTKTADDGTVYYLNVEILSSAIQSTPAAAVQEAWPDVVVSSNKLTKK